MKLSLNDHVSIEPACSLSRLRFCSPMTPVEKATLLDGGKAIWSMRTKSRASLSPAVDILRTEPVIRPTLRYGLYFTIICSLIIHFVGNAKCKGLQHSHHIERDAYRSDKPLSFGIKQRNTQRNE
jgi:hypothetical protein